MNAGRWCLYSRLLDVETFIGTCSKSCVWVFKRVQFSKADWRDVIFIFFIFSVFTCWQRYRKPFSVARMACTVTTSLCYSSETPASLRISLKLDSSVKIKGHVCVFFRVFFSFSSAYRMRNTILIADGIQIKNNINLRIKWPRKKNGLDVHGKKPTLTNKKGEKCPLLVLRMKRPRRIGIL